MGPQAKREFDAGGLQQRRQQDRLVGRVAGPCHEGALGAPQDARVGLVADLLGDEPEDPLDVELEGQGQVIDGPRGRRDPGGEPRAEQRTERAHGEHSRPADAHALEEGAAIDLPAACRR